MMSNEKNLPAGQSDKRSIQLHDGGRQSGSLIDQAFSRLDEQQAQGLVLKAAEEALRLEVKNREQVMEYRFGKQAAEDHIETFNMIERQGPLTRQKVVSDIKTGAGNMRIESKSGMNCFVATVAYNDSDHPDVTFLRRYRDEVLSGSAFGNVFIAWYWKNGPKIAEMVRTSAILKFTARSTIATIVRVLRATNRI